MWKIITEIFTANKAIKTVALLITVSIISNCMFFRSRFIDYELSGAVTLNQEWLEIEPKEALKVERDTQELTLYPDPPIQMKINENAKLIPVDGRSATIEVELTDSNDNIYTSSSGGETMTGDLQITSRKLDFKNLPRDAVFKKVRIKSSSLYPVRKIIWRCYNWAEVHK